MSVRVAEIVVADEESFIAVALAVELAPAVGVHVTLREVEAVRVDRPVAIRPHMKRAGLVGFPVLGSIYIVAQIRLSDFASAVANT